MPEPREPMSLQQYLILSLMSFRGVGVRVAVTEITEELKVAGPYIDAGRNDRGMQGFLTQLVLGGYLFIGVIDGHVVFKPSGKELSPEDLERIDSVGGTLLQKKQGD